MPNSTLPSTDYLGDSGRTTSEFQTAIDQLQNWVITLQSELNALSGTTVQEGAVRDATSNTASGTLVLRDANGRAQFADPAAAQDGVTKTYLESLTLTDADWYEEGTISLTNSGTSNISGDVTYVRMGNMVVIKWEDLTHDTNSDPGTDVVLPASIRPAHNVENMYSQLGAFNTVRVYTTGELAFVYYDETTSNTTKTSTNIGSIAYTLL